MAIDCKKLQQALTALSAEQRARFGMRCALRALPMLVAKDAHFSYWPEEKVDQYLISLPHAVNLAAVYNDAYNVIVAACDAYTYDARDDAAAYAAYTAAFANVAYAAASHATQALLHGNIIRLNNDFYHQDIVNLQHRIDAPLWPAGAPSAWSTAARRLIAALRQRKLDYWADQYAGWIAGRFDREKIQHAARMPQSTIKAGVEAQLAYLRAEVRRRFGETRVIYLGEAGAGKTSLIRRLHGETIRPHEGATTRVEIRERTLERTGQQLRVHDWDFGGQLIMHATHQFFLSEKVIYVVVIDIRREDALVYWLEHARVFGNGAPTLVVLNKIDTMPSGVHTPLEFDPKALQKRYHFVNNFHKMSCEDGAGLDAVRAELEALCWQNEVLSAQTPESWFTVKEQLRAKHYDHISCADFVAICRQCDLVDETEITGCLSALNQLGAAIHFPDLDDQVVLNAEWITKALYFVIWSSEDYHRRGLLSQNVLRDLYASGRQSGELEVAVADEQIPFLLKLMVRFELAYRIKGTVNEYQIPMLAPVNQPDRRLLQASGHPYFRFRFDFLPPALYYRFIVQCSAEIAPNGLWREGALLQHLGAWVQVEYWKDSNSMVLLMQSGDDGNYIALLRQRLYALLGRGEAYEEIAYQVEWHRADARIFNWAQILNFASRNDYCIPDSYGELVDLRSEMRRCFAKNDQNINILQNELVALRRSATPSNMHFEPHITVGGNKTHVNVEQRTEITIRIDQQLDELESDLVELGRDLRRAQNTGAQMDACQLQKIEEEIAHLREDVRQVQEKTPTPGLIRRVRKSWELLQQAMRGVEQVGRVAEAFAKVGGWMREIPWDSLA